MDKLIITAALTGAGTTKKHAPAVPITPDEIAADVVAVAKAGAAIAHLHVRDKDGNNTMETDVWVEVYNKVKEAMAKAGVDIILNLTSSGGKFPLEMRLAHLRKLKPEMCSYDPGTMNWANSYVFLNPPEFLEQLGKLTMELDIKPEIEIFDGSMIGNAKYYIKKGFIKTPAHFQFVLGVPGGLDGNVDSLAFLLPKLPEDSTWSITGIGRTHMPMMLAGLAEGCNGLRVGLEDNVLMSKGVPATNVSLVERAVKLARLAGREIATAQEAREILGITKR
ncbi:MAG: 3-keto-5-aminohexanoate cleavage protein [Desulfitobacteriia bacterium]|jgi:3-keto-5-aminohexanoate cleavage enzyme